MIYVELSSGLGNQFFQYAMARKIQIDTNEAVSYCYKGKKGYLEAERKISIDRFSIDSGWKREEPCPYYSKHRTIVTIEKLIAKLDSISNISVEKQKEHKQKEIRFLEKMGRITHQEHIYLPLVLCSKTKDIFISGLWHHPMFFETIKGVLFNELELRDKQSLPKDILSKIVSTESVAVHIRRGDYLNYPYYIVADIWKIVSYNFLLP